MTKAKAYLNLTNGIELIPHLKGEEFGFIRIQSSQCEAKAWLQVLMDIDNNFLMYVAMGFTCIVYDFSQRKVESRALFQGLEFVKYTLRRRWYNQEDAKAWCKNIDCTEYFKQEYDRLFRYDQDKWKEMLKSKYDYFRKFVLTEEPSIVPITIATKHDSQNDFYKQLVATHATDCGITTVPSSVGRCPTSGEINICKEDVQEQ